VHSGQLATHLHTGVCVLGSPIIRLSIARTSNLCTGIIFVSKEFTKEIKESLV